MLTIASISGKKWPDLKSEEGAMREFQEWIYRHLDKRKGEEPPLDIIDYVREIMLEMGKLTPDWPDADCDGFSSFLVALARAAGIPARVITGKGLPLWAHAWVEAFYGGKWQVWDPGFNRGYGDDYKAFTDWHKSNTGLFKLVFVYDELAVNRGKDYGAIWPFGDINLDDVIDYKDLAILAAAYGKSEGEPGFNVNADLNRDGKIDYKDLAILAANYRMSGK